MFVHSLAARLWKGQYPLGITFWLFAVVFCFGSAVAIAFAIELTQSMLLAASGLLAIWMLAAMAGISVWRAAGAYAGPRAWATLARAATALAILLLLYLTTRLLGI